MLLRAAELSVCALSAVDAGGESPYLRRLLVH